MDIWNVLLAASDAQNWHTVLWIAAVALIATGIYKILAQGAIALGVVLIVLGFLVGPGGVSIFN